MKRITAVFLSMLVCAITLGAQTQEGRGTWYETDSKGLTASHANLPFGTRVRVTNLQNDRTVIVTIDNRIVETPNRLIDISKAAADNLEMNARGTTPVRIEVLSRRTAPVTPVNPPVQVQQAPQEPIQEASPPNDELTVTTSATARRPTTPVQEPVQQQTPALPTNPAGIVNQTIITINGIPAAAGQGGVPTVISTDPSYTGADGVSATAGPNPVAVSPAFAAPAPAVVSPNPAIVAPSPAVIAPTPAVISPVIVPPVIAQPVLTPPVLAPPILAEPVISVPIVSEPVRSEPVRSEPVRSEPVTVAPVRTAPPVKTKAPSPSKSYAPPPVMTAPAAPVYSGGVVPARILPRRPDPGSRAIYRVQVGAFLDERNAVDAYRRLASAGFSPAYERYQNYYRIVLTGVRAGEIENIAWRLGAANFTELLLREEY
jgi:hypothetical protein